MQLYICISCDIFYFRKKIQYLRIFIHRGFIFWLVYLAEESIIFLFSHNITVLTVKDWKL